LKLFFFVLFSLDWYLCHALPVYPRASRESQVTSSVTEHTALGRDIDAAWSRAQQSQARVAEATKLLKAA
jgi:hypothetical protein